MRALWSFNMENKFKYMRLPEEYWKCTLSELPDNGSSKNTKNIPYKEIVREWVLNFKEKSKARGLYLYGPYGTGKSGIGAILLKAGMAHGLIGLWVNFNSLSEIQIKADDIMFSNTTSMYERLFEVDVLFVDEIQLKKNKHFGLGLLEDIVRHRHQNKKVTFLASNHSPSDLKNFELTVGLHSILSEATDSLMIDGKNFRKR
jgi:DNA replication protein DnaC